MVAEAAFCQKYYQMLDFVDSLNSHVKAFVSPKKKQKKTESFILSNFSTIFVACVVLLLWFVLI